MPLRNAQRKSATDYYDYEHIESLRHRKIGWREIGTHYPLKHWGSVRRFFESETKRRSDKSRIKKISRVNDQPVNRQTKNQKSNGKLPTYGRIPPTDYKSGLIFNEWRQHYCKRKKHWILPYIDHVIDIYFQVIDNYQFIMPGVPRDYGKTFIGIDFLAYIIAEHHYTALVITSGGGSSRRFFNEVKAILTTDKFRADYGDIIATVNRTDKEIWLHEELRNDNDIDPNLRVTGRGGDIIGGHPTLVFLEDFVQTPYKSNESEEGMRDWFSAVVHNLNAPITGTFTRKSPDDIYGWMQAEHEIVLDTKPAFIKEGAYPARKDFINIKAPHPKLIERGKTHAVNRWVVRPDYDLSEFTLLECPNYDIHSMLWKRGFTPSKIRAFESEMMQRPLPKSGSILSDAYWKDALCDAFNPGRTPYYTYCDPAFGMKTGADFNAVITVMPYAGHLYVVDIILRKNLGFNAIVRLIRDEVNKWRSIHAGVHKDFHEAWLHQGLAGELSDIKPIKSRVNKIDRIDALEIPFEDRKLKIFRDCTDITEAYRQYIQYDRKPSTPTKKDDFLDILASAYQDLKHKLIDTGSILTIRPAPTI
jgi:hypothetical protein